MPFSCPNFKHIRFAVFQQPLNTCNISALGFGLTMLNYPTDIDDIYAEPASMLTLCSIVDEGLYLDQVAPLSHRIRIRVRVRWLH